MRTVAPRATSSLVILSILLLGSAGVLGSPQAYADEGIQAGVDLFETPEGMSSLSFAATPIPAGFFDPGSELFGGVVPLCGDPQSPSDLGSTDTTLRRLNALNFGEENTGTVPIELVQLNLVSCEPITVVINSQPTEWNVQISLSDTPAPRGSMSVTKTHANGGVFTSEFSVMPKFTFTQVGGTEVGGGEPLIFDSGRTGTIGGPVEGGSPLSTFNVQATNVPWVFEHDGACPGQALRIPGETSNFCASSTEADRVKTMATSGDFTHAYQPARALIFVPGVTIDKTSRGGGGTFDFDIRPLNIGVVSTRSAILTTTEPDFHVQNFFDIWVDVDSLTGLKVQERTPQGWQVNDQGICTINTIDPVIAQSPPPICTFLNTKEARIIIKKLTDPANDPQTFEFSGDVGGILKDTETAAEDVAPGTYTSTEVVPNDWVLDSIICDDSDSTGDVPSATAIFRVDAGETVTCTFTNTKEVIEAPTCNGKLATIFVDGTNHVVGGPQNGLLYAGMLQGTPGDDVMVATDGRDAVIGRGGNDTICTLDGLDRVITLKGNDWIDAGEGNNTVNAGHGDDTVRSGGGNDKLHCGQGSDTASPGAGVNHLNNCEVILP